MFRNKDELLPRTYSIKSYRRRRTISLSKTVKLLAFIGATVLLLSLVVMSAFHLI